MVLASSLLALALSGLAIADDRAQFAQETGLDIDLVGVIQIDVNGTELTVVFVFINDRTFDSRISPSLRATLLPYVGRNAVYVNPNVKSVVSWFGFDPLEISVQASGGAIIPTERASWIEITPGFFQGRFDVNPAGASQGSGSEGILLLGEAIDSDEPFDLIYGGERTTFAISAAVMPVAGPSVGGPAAATTSHEPIEIPLLENVPTLEEILALPDFTSESMSALFALDEEDVGTAEVTFLNDEILRLLYIRLEESIRDSALGSEFVETVEPLIGTGAVMVWAFSPTGVDFSPWSFFVQQSDTNYVFFSSASFVELTPGFVRIDRIGANKMTAGIIRLPKGVSSALPYAIFYVSTGVTFP